MVWGSTFALLVRKLLFVQLTAISAQVMGFAISCARESSERADMTLLTYNTNRRRRVALFCFILTENQK